ncbi:metabolism of cobalamin associated Da [Lates japonicus]|uniref:Metabolism of cobalamin associated Da n=1 Tax=Lates japonicus TaxID=270547 RepID=A0AAD3N127_LATJO|nr:metabolism of cobalamin associated Da [Lates japonicus]
MSKWVLWSRGRLVLSQTAGRQKNVLCSRVSRTEPSLLQAQMNTHNCITHRIRTSRTRRFQLPGNVGFDCLEADQKTRSTGAVPDVLADPRQHRDTSLYWPSLSSEFQRPTSILVSQQSHRGAVGREETAEQDGDQLMHKFVSGAKEMCFALWTAGYWADFIDPTTGAAFFASPSSQTTLQTEEELRHLGFHIEVSGSCTVIRHILRGTPLFVGTVFTNAPTQSAAIARLQGLSNVLDDEE